ncbi:MAG: hypothetical protein NW217_03565 [Hyphomicrobiaceae bacterium]|nr:hypothetical protein [Hyphomicrobiaceae bacterium]
METLTVEVAQPGETQARPRAMVSHACVGLLIVSILPALFWTAVLATMAPLLGYQPGVGILLLFGATVALFLGLVFAGIALSPDPDAPRTGR